MIDDFTMLAPGVPTLATETIEHIDRELGRTERVHREALCLICGKSGIHAHYQDGVTTRCLMIFDD